MSKISVAIIARNSEDVIGRCLESVKDADQIVLLDTGSDTDQTIEIAKQYGAETHSYYGCNEGGKRDGLFMNFADARNKALEYCTGDYILTIDADEELVQGMDEMKAFTGVSMAVRCISQITGEEHHQPRLYKRHPEIYWKGAAHNYVTCHNGTPSNALIRYHHNKQKDRDPDRTLRILKHWIKNNPKDCTREMYYLGHEYSNRRDWKMAARTYERYIKRSTFKAEKADAFLMLSKAYAYQNEILKARNAVMAAINLNPHFAEAYRMAGELSEAEQRIKYYDVSQRVSNANVLFIRPDTRKKITVLSKIDWAGSGRRIVDGVKLFSERGVDIEHIVCYEGQGSKDWAINKSPSIYRLGLDTVKRRLDMSDILHFKGDWPVGDSFEGIPLKDFPGDRSQARIHTVSGSLFRRIEPGLIPEVAGGKFTADEYKADLKTTTTPDLVYEKDWIYTPFVWQNFDYKFRRKKKFRIVHIPSDPLKKGTQLINEAIDLLDRKDIEYICQFGIPYNKALAIKQTAHLYIDQMVIYAYSNAAVAAMAMGIPVMSGILRELYSEECPVIAPHQRTAEGIAAAIDEALNWEFLEYASQRSFEFCKKEHGMMPEKWIDIYNDYL